jgi:hypothetical protein
MAQMKITMAEARRDKSVADESARSLQSDLASRVSSVAQRLELLNERFLDTGRAIAPGKRS